MRVLYAGCNLFGQVTDSLDVAFESFVRFDVADLRELVAGQSVLVVRTGGGVKLLGHGLKPRETHVVTDLEVPADGVETIAVSDTRVFMVDAAGELHVLDFLDRDVAVRHKRNCLMQSRSFSSRILRFASGIGISVAVTEGGRVFNLPNLLQKRVEDVVQVCAGNEHCLLLDERGGVHSFGGGIRGQLGHGDLTSLDQPERIRALEGLGVVKIAAGNWHSCALTSSGDVYVWGWNSDGQLGLFEQDRDDKEDHSNKPVSLVAEPTLLKLDLDVKIVAMCCGSRHTVLIADDMTVYGFGCNKFNQLAMKNRTAIHKVTKIYQIKDNMELHDVQCGPACTTILLK